MLKVHPEYLIDKEKKAKAIVLPISEWEQILEELEELDDIRAYDKAKSKNDESIDFETAVRAIKDGKIS
ncbi:MAG: hypothetical protein ACLFSQ_09365 [Candidatus Zixiibacteriota bacterium]